MKTKFCITAICWFMASSSLFAQTYMDDEIKESDLIEFRSDLKRKPTESASQFARRLIPKNAAFKHKVLEIPFMNPKVGKDIFVCFADSTLTEQKPTVFVELLMPILFEDKIVYEPGFITGFENGVEGLASVDAVFLANADKDAAKELVIIYSTTMRKYNAPKDSWYIEDISEVAIYDNDAEQCNLHVCLEEMEIVEKKFPASKIPYSAQTVKAKLKSLGYR